MGANFKTKMSTFLIIIFILTSLSISSSFAETTNGVRFIMVSAGTEHVLALQDNGVVWSWGKNTHGELGNGTTSNSLVPIKIKNLSDVISIATGPNSSLAVKKDGTVWAWGDNIFGELGLASGGSHLSPEKIEGLSGITSVAAGNFHGIAMGKNGSVWAWGQNSDGQVGDGTYIKKNTPVKISKLSNIVSIAAGGNHSFAVDKSGFLYFWGKRFPGKSIQDKKGENSTPTSLSNFPQKLNWLSGVKSVSASTLNAVAVKNDGSAYVWGLNDKISDPERLENISDVKASACGYGFILFLQNKGTIWGYGNNQFGQLGTTDLQTSKTLLKISGISNITGISCGFDSSYALTKDGKIYSWGKNQSGQLGIGFKGIQESPAKSDLLKEIKDLKCSTHHVLALTQDGFVHTWGLNDNGELGNGSRRGSVSPVKINDLRDIKEISTGYNFSIALEDDGTVWGWGDNYFGQLGNGEVGVTYKKPVIVDFPNNIIKVAAGDSFVAALKNDGTVWVLGDDRFGVAYDENYLENTLEVLDSGPQWFKKSKPVKVDGLSGVTDIGVGFGHIIALKNDGTVWTWGRNEFKQLGIKNITHTFIPTKVQGLSDITQISACAEFNLVLKKDGTVWAWGYNTSGELGDGTGEPRETPVKVKNLSNIISIKAAGDSGNVHYYSVALKSDGTVWTWGYNNMGQLGDGPIDSLKNHYRYDPKMIKLKDAASIYSGGGLSTFVKKKDGSIWSFGDNIYGQLAYGYSGFVAEPVLVNGSVYDPKTKAVKIFQNNNIADKAKTDSLIPAYELNNKIFASKPLVFADGTDSKGLYKVVNVIEVTLPPYSAIYISSGAPSEEDKEFYTGGELLIANHSSETKVFKPGEISSYSTYYTPIDTLIALRIIVYNGDFSDKEPYSNYLTSNDKIKFKGKWIYAKGKL